MDPSDPRPSPRRELQGPRPAPLRVSRDSHKIKKPPVAPPHHHYHHPAAELPPRPPLPQQPTQSHHRDPVIIYSVSPKIIHAKPSEFMTLVQRLTGPDSASADAPLPSPGGALSPAARIASFEASPRASARAASVAVDGQLGIVGGEPALDRPAPFPGILSPVPASLPPISPSLFSPSFDLSFLFELSPVFSNKNTNNSSSSTFLGSPSNNLLSTPIVPSPGAFYDLFSQFPDL
ncbi:protein MKS1-like [Canna indica]|uniref:Protein MKS1-like n=1 Tax=Canna indica TaxID=4628 RepID=A0AAQ3K5B1_9LILI|nr:protein MKS1-like [Canna indica]